MPANAYSTDSMTDWQTPELMRKSMLPPASAGLSAPVSVPLLILPCVLLSVLLCVSITRPVHAAAPDEALPKWEVGLGVAAARLADYLLYLLEEQGREDSVELEISKGQLASLLGTIPETLSRIFAKMTEEGLIEVVGRRINILDRHGLEAR